MIKVFNEIGSVRYLEDDKISAKKQPYILFKLPVTTGYGEKAHTEWYKCLVTQPRLVERFKKAKVKEGSFIQVVGSEGVENYVKKDGNPGQSRVVDVYAFAYVYSGKKQEDGERASAPAGNGAAASAPPPAQTSGEPSDGSGFEEMALGEDEEDLPF